MRALALAIVLAAPLAFAGCAEPSGGGADVVVSAWNIRPQPVEVVVLLDGKEALRTTLDGDGPIPGNARSEPVAAPRGAVEVVVRVDAEPEVRRTVDLSRDRNVWVGVSSDGVAISAEDSAPLYD